MDIQIGKDEKDGMHLLGGRNEISGTLNGGGVEIALKAISSDIYIRKKITLKITRLMKKLIFILVCTSALCCPGFGQNITKATDQSFKLPSSKQVALNLKFASTIKVTSWSKNELGLKTIITASSDDLRKLHEVEVKEGNVLQIETDYAVEGMKKYDQQCWGCNEESGENCTCLEVSYEIQLPSSAELKLETISGDIEIRDFEGKTQAKTISGYVDLGLSTRANRDISFKSVTGEIYTDFDVALDKDSSPWSKKLNASLNGGGGLISLETVSGDIFFRKE